MSFISGLASLLLVVVLISSPPAFSAAIPSPQITVEADRQSATVGDRVAYTLTVVYDSALRLIPPAPARTLGAFDVLNDTVLSDGAIRKSERTYRRRWYLAAFATGDHWIPAASGELVNRARERTAWQSDSMLITINSVLTGAADTADIRGLKEPYWAPVSYWLWFIVAALLVCGAVALWWWRRRRRRAAVIPTAPAIPAWELALTALGELRQRVDPDHDGARQWYFGLSDILRRYWDARYGWQSIDQTTPEIVSLLADAPFNGTHRQRASEFLRTADLVRYARASARAEQARTDWDWIRTFVEETVPRAMPPSTNSTYSAEAVSRSPAAEEQVNGRGDAP